MKQLATLFLLSQIFSHSLAETAEEIATRIVTTELKDAPISGFSELPSELGDTYFLLQLLKKENESLRVLYALKQAEADQRIRQSRTEEESKPRKEKTIFTDKNGEDHEIELLLVPKPLIPEAELSILREKAKEYKKNQNQAVEDNAGQPPPASQASTRRASP